MSDLPRVSAIIVSYNRSANLRRAIEALLDSDYPNLEVIVVDNASSDDAPDVAASYPSIKLVRNAENLGFAQGNNQGLALATGEYIALVNNDAVVEKSWMRELAAFLDAHPDAGAAGGKVYFWNDDNPLGDRTNQYYSYTIIDPETGYSEAFLDTPDEVREVATLSGAVVMIRRKMIDDVGAPFLEPEFFTYYEETDFFARGICRGWRLYYTGTPAAWHRLRASTARQPYRYFYYMERNRILFAYRNLSDPMLRGFVARTRKAALSELARHPLRLIGGRDDGARARRDAWLWALENRRVLEQQRAMVDRRGCSYDEAVRAVEMRAGYYGYERPEVVALVPADARIIVDVGCAAGGLGKALKDARPDLQVRGIEPVREQRGHERSMTMCCAAPPRIRCRPTGRRRTASSSPMCWSTWLIRGGSYGGGTTCSLRAERWS